MSEPEPEPVDTTDAEDADILLADPEDYHRTQRLREIHEARRKAADALREIDTHTDKNEHSTQRGALAHHVTAYINELLPLLDQFEYEADFPESFPFKNLRDYAMATGYLTDEDRYAGYMASNMVFQEANSFLAEIKPLITEDETDEWEV